MRKISSFVSLCAFIAMMCFTSTARADETELDDVLQGDYDEREEILADFNDILDRILEYQIYQDKK